MQNAFPLQLLVKKYGYLCQSNQETAVDFTNFLAIFQTSLTFWKLLITFSSAGSGDYMIINMCSITLIWACSFKMAFIFLKTSSSLFRIFPKRVFGCSWWKRSWRWRHQHHNGPHLREHRVEKSLKRSSSSFMDSYCWQRRRPRRLG